MFSNSKSRDVVRASFSSEWKGSVQLRNTRANLMIRAKYVTAKCHRPQGARFAEHINGSSGQSAARVWFLSLSKAFVLSRWVFGGVGWRRSTAALCSGDGRMRPSPDRMPGSTAKFSNRKSLQTRLIWCNFPVIPIQCIPLNAQNGGW